MVGTGAEKKRKKRHSLYIKQNRAYQVLMAILIIAFIFLAGAVISHTYFDARFWDDNVLIRMIIERRAPR